MSSLRLSFQGIKTTNPLTANGLDQLSYYQEAGSIVASSRDAWVGLKAVVDIVPQHCPVPVREASLAERIEGGLLAGKAGAPLESELRQLLWRQVTFFLLSAPCLFVSGPQFEPLEVSWRTLARDSSVHAANDLSFWLHLVQAKAN